MPEFTPAGYLLLGLTGFVGVLMGVLGFAVMRIAGAARDSGRHLRESNVETALLSAALQEAVTKLRAQERTTLARAEASERLNAQIVDGLTSGLLVADGGGRVRMLNPAGHRILGVAPRPMPAPIDEVLGDVPALASLVHDAVTNGRTAVSRRHVDTGLAAGPSHLGVTLSPWAGGQPGETGVICLFTDLSRVVALEEQLRLKDALAQLGELTAGLAHEFRNGLSTIHGYARLLDPSVLPAPQSTYAEGLRAETQALGTMVTNFLNFARPERLLLLPLALEPVVRKAVHDVDPEGTAVVVAGDFGEVDGDEALLRQAFSNLVRNALEACRGAGIAPQVEILGSTGEDGVIDVTVGDNGPGLPATGRDRLFQPFFTTKQEGTGLGLALVLKFVVTHNGQVRAGDRPGGGALFSVRLPARGHSVATTS